MYSVPCESTLDIYAAMVCWTCSLNKCTYRAYRKRTLHGIYIFHPRHLHNDMVSITLEITVISAVLSKLITLTVITTDQLVNFLGFYSYLPLV